MFAGDGEWREVWLGGGIEVFVGFSFGRFALRMRCTGIAVSMCEI